MRFEIGPRGGFAILAGLLVLSASVFLLGIISGREMVQRDRGQSQLVRVYPIPAGVPSASPPQVAKSAELTATPVAAAALTPSPPGALTSVGTLPAEMPKPSHEYKALLDPPKNVLSINRSTRTRHPRYKIMIDAAMDRAAAEQMTARLLGLGYTCQIVPNQINGQTWYRVQLGPYPTTNIALAAQAKLRAAYTARYISTGAARIGPAEAASATDTNSDGRGGRNSAPIAYRR